MLDSDLVLRVYLDEIDPKAEPSLGMGIVQLILETEQRAANRAQQLIEQVERESTDNREREKLLYLVETILF